MFRTINKTLLRPVATRSYSVPTDEFTQLKRRVNDLEFKLENAVNNDLKSRRKIDKINNHNLGVGIGSICTSVALIYYMDIF